MEISRLSGDFVGIDGLLVVAPDALHRSQGHEQGGGGNEDDILFEGLRRVERCC